MVPFAHVLVSMYGCLMSRSCVVQPSSGTRDKPLSWYSVICIIILVHTGKYIYTVLGKMFVPLVVKEISYFSSETFICSETFK